MTALPEVNQNLFSDSPATFHPDSTDRLSTGKRKPLPGPRPHQTEAIKDVISGFQTHSRGQLIMPCATGKTWTCMWVKEDLQAKRTLVLVPSLNLLSQLLNDWVSAAQQPFEALCVCSDPTVTERDYDEPVTRIEDLSLPFPVSHKASVIADFLRKDSNIDQVIFSTYQSSPLIAEAQKDADVPHFDLAIADEAHRCAGKVDSVFGTILSERIKSDRRLFATATPRIFTRSAKKTAEVHGYEVIDMNDEKGFGPRFHTLPFSKAIKDNLLTDYQVVIVGVDNNRIKEIKDLIEKRQLVETDTGLLTDAKSLAVSIAVLKAIKDYNLEPQNGYRMISFHGRIKRAREFSEDILQVAEWLSEEHKPQGKLWATHVSGEMPTDFRTQMLKRLKNIGAGEIGLLSNARCLSEGVDVPALDAIVFVDPKGSEIDIIQSVGRAIRLSQNKTMGTIILPVFIDETSNAEEALESSEFRPVWDVLEALKSHDDRLCTKFDQLRIASGATRKRVSANDLKNIHFDLPTFVDENFAQSFRTFLVENTTARWMFWYGLLQAYVNEHGHARVPGGYKTDDGYRLGSWVNTQRHDKDLTSDRRQYLEMLPGWSWDIYSDQFEEGFSHLKEFVEREGHCRVPQRYKTDDGYQLGTWTSNQRQDKGKTSLDRQQRLEALPGWSWDVRSDQWQEGFSHLEEFVKQIGHCRVPQLYKTKDGYPLGVWLTHQRKLKDKMESNRRQRLEALPRWSWNAISDQWEDGFFYLNEFVNEHGHCRVPQPYETDGGYPLGVWLNNQRRNKDKMNLNRQRRLEALPDWSWNLRSGKWEKRFSYLKEFAEREGHCRVPYNHKTDDGYPLGVWVYQQKRFKDKMNSHRRRRLEVLPGWSWDIQNGLRKAA
jgi:superfamily II DNA or RNA helicase